MSKKVTGVYYFFGLSEMLPLFLFQKSFSGRFVIVVSLSFPQPLPTVTFT